MSSWVRFNVSSDVRGISISLRSCIAWLLSKARTLKAMPSMSPSTTTVLIERLSKNFALFFKMYSDNNLPSAPYVKISLSIGTVSRERSTDRNREFTL